MSGSKVKVWLPLFLISFASLFFEVLSIRWISSEIRSLAYFKNIVLMAAVVGLGIGCSQPGTSGKRLDPLVRFSLGFTILSLLLFFAPDLQLTHMRFVISSHSVEWMTFLREDATALALNVVKIVAIFLLIAWVFDQLGQALGSCFEKHPPLPAYAVNLLGSVAGVLVYSALCYMQAPPAIWLAVGFLSLAPLLSHNRRQLLILSGLACISTALAFASSAGSLWSPYYRLDTAPYVLPLAGSNVQVGSRVEVNHGTHQWTIDLSPRNLDLHPELKSSLDYLNYSLPFKFVDKKDRVLVIGAGTGNDVAAALRAGAGHVDAVEIDPAIRHLGDSIHPEFPYKDPRVNVHINDARAYLESDKNKYDIIDFAYLDSHTAFSIASAVRLDNYLYTVESLRTASAHLAPDGIGVLSFAAGTDWLKSRFYKLVSQQSHGTPLVLRTGFVGNGITIFWGPGLNQIRPRIEKEYSSLVMPSTAFDPSIEATTDDWPFLYQKQREIPILYAVVLLLLSFVSVSLILVRFRPAPRQLLGNLQFFLLGTGFLLLETRGMLASAVLFGSTWIVNSIVIALVLLMSCAGNFLVMKLQRLNQVIGYAGIFAGLGILYLVPLSDLAGQPLPVKLLGTLVILGIPFMSAGVVFSRAFRCVKEAPVALGINIMGAVLGICLEYSSLLIGTSSLTLVAAATYGLSIAAALHAPKSVSSRT